MLGLTFGTAALLGSLALLPAAQAQDANPATCVADYDPAVNYFPDRVQSVHALQWDIAYHDSYKVLTVPNSEFPDQADLTYVLVQCGTPAPELTGDLEGALLVEIPVDRAIVTSRNALAMLDEIDRVDTVVGLSGNFFGFAESDAWYASILERAASPLDVASESDMDFETALALEADAIFMAGYGPSYEEVATVRGRGLPSVMVSNRIEPTPLGSAEWVKFVAAFYNQEAAANAVFDSIETDYTTIAGEVAGQLTEDYEAAYACLGDEGGCGFTYAHGASSLNGQILDLMGVSNPFAQGNDRPNGMGFDYEAALGRTQDTDFFIIYSIGSPAALESDPRYRNVPALAAGNYIISTIDNYYECNAVTYVRVDRLVRDYAIGMFPKLFPGEEGVCFQAPGN